VKVTARSAVATPMAHAATIAVAILVGLFAAWAVVVVRELDGTTRSLVVAMPFGAAAAAAAFFRYEWFILGLIAIRSVLDVFDTGFRSGTTMEPAAAVAVLLIVTGFMWLAAQWSVGALRRPAPPTIALWALVLAGLVSTVMSSDREASIEWNIRLVAGVVMFTVLEQMLAQRPSFVRPLLLAVVASAVVPITVGFYQAATGSGSETYGMQRVRSTFPQPNTFGTYLVIVLLACVALATVLRGPRRSVLAALVAAGGAALVLTLARGAWIAATAGLVLLGIKLERRLLWLLAAGVLAAIALAPSTVARVQDLTDEHYTGNGNANSLEWRIQYWGELIESSSGTTRLNGIGLEEVQRTTTEELQPHNVFVQTYVELGAFGVAALIAVIATMWIYLVDRARVARTPFDRGVAWGACAVGLALLVLFVSENLLTYVGAYWYGAAAMAYGYRPVGADVWSGGSRQGDRGMGDNGDGYRRRVPAHLAGER
jgi:O-antigen ligase